MSFEQFIEEMEEKYPKEKYPTLHNPIYLFHQWKKQYEEKQKGGNNNAN